MSRLIRGPALFMFLVLISVALPTSAQGQAMQNNIAPWRDPSSGPVVLDAPTPPNLHYYGGPVISKVQVVQVLYGMGSYDPQVQGIGTPNMGTFYADITNSGFIDLLSQYNTTASGGTNQTIGYGTFDRLSPIIPSELNNGAIITDTQIQAELLQQIKDGHLPSPNLDAAGNVNTVYMVFFPPGKQDIVLDKQGNASSCLKGMGGFCAYHGATSEPFQSKPVLYGVHPDLQAGSACASMCGSSTTFNNYTSMTSHELAEAITDPQSQLAPIAAAPKAWYDNLHFAEIGDICNLQQGVYVANGTTYTIQLEFSNIAGACVLPPAAPTPLTVNPKSVRLKAKQTQTFSAAGGAIPPTVDWSLDPPNNPAAGSITASGVYTAPNKVTITIVTVIATSKTDGSKGTATVFLNSCISRCRAVRNISAAIMGQAYSDTVQDPAAEIPAGYRLTGNLPPNLNFAANTGLITGTPVQPPAIFGFAVTPFYADGDGTTQQYALPVCQAVSATPLSVGPFTINSSYSITYVPGANPPAMFSYRLSNGTLPPGMALDASTGIVAGTPTAAGTYTYTISTSLAFGTPATLPACTSGTSSDATYQVTISCDASCQMTLTSTRSPGSADYGTTLIWTATASGGTPASTQYAFFRRRLGTTPWTPDVTAPIWQASNVLSWTPTSSDVGTWETYIWVKDGNTPANANTYGYAAGYNSGPVQITVPLTLTGTGSPGPTTYGTNITWTASASGGTPASTQYAFFRRRLGTTPWTPDVAAPIWQASNVLSWTPTSSDVSTWETYVWVKDGNTPANANTYGYAAGYNPGPVQITAPLTLTGTGSPGPMSYGMTLTWTAIASGGTAASTQYAFFRRRLGTTPWTPDVTAPIWQASNVLSWTPTSSDVSTWETYIWVKDGNTPANANTYGYAAGYNPGPVQITAPLTLTGTGSPGPTTYGTNITWTASASGGTPASTQYAFFRRRLGTTPWTPDVTAPIWQASNVLNWTPTASDVGTWETYIWVKDGNTLANANTYGYAAGYNPGPVQITAPAPLTLTGTGSPGSATYGTNITWTASASGGTPASTQYAFFRRRLGTTPWTPDVTAPIWQASNVLSWTPTASDVGDWETYIWVKDGNTPANANTYGYAAGYNPGPVQITAPPAP